MTQTTVTSLLSDTEPFHFNWSCPRLLITIDTEEIFDWETDSFHEYKLADTPDIARLQELCEASEIKPLYFLTWPLITSDSISGFYLELHKRGVADLGIHLHGWVTPPHEETICSRNSYQCNLPQSLHRKKIATLMYAFEKAFGFSPNTHRAGRYGVSAAVQNDLSAAGLHIDFSPGAYFDLSADDGPDFSLLRNNPWIRRSNSQPDLLSLPVTAGRFWKRTKLAIPERFYPSSADNIVNNITRKLSAPARLSPEGVHLETMKALTEHAVRQGQDLLILSLHSTSLTKGATPYSRSEHDIKHLLKKMMDFIHWFKQGVGKPCRLSEIEDRWKELSARMT